MELVILDNFGLTMLTAHARSDLLEILDDGAGTGSMIVAGQIPIKKWHALINDPVLADAILHQLILSRHKIEVTGESMRKKKGGPTK